ncbi:RagB/SusD family nutrient uptake outer membrane protein [Flavobacterium cheongpyeongense]|uniref:RagB/SusD family nutrient uptake outer membrane protein n=1 Tax=Flavobacterium cheongpyeongense TaxID=2212651 RepID=A0A2V4BRU4_9FLAO|nr:RagB/SusD family nutrient uptake outer membrane protein [Flavobacterium cheongpyeongense]PXY41798.1 RagB/SusD family nutrient uptake outer membrane protein [Flavobacterium cheongpyeongense]
MRTKINLYITLALLLVVSASCSDDFLEDKKNYGQIDDSFYESEQRTTWYINNVYYDFFSSYTSPLANTVGLYTTDQSKLTEEIGGITDLINPNKTFVNAADGSTYYGTTITSSTVNNPYSRIRDINGFLRDIDVKGASLSQAFRDKAKGQMYYLRAIQYFDLMRTYGGVPIVLTVQAASSTDESIKLPRATVAEVVSQIVADLDLAATLLPGQWDVATDYGRFTRGAALAQKSRVLLTYASPLFNKNWDSTTDRWDAALQAGLAAETQLTADGFGLYGSSAKDWANMFLIDNAFCKEAITVQMLSSNTTVALNNSWEKSIRLKSQSTATGGISVPKDMIDLFPMKDGSKPTVANGYDPFLFFKDRDPRFYRTFAFSGAKWPYKESTSNTVWGYRWVDAANKEYFSDGNQTSSPAYVRKMSNPTASNASSFQYSSTDIFEYRYAELLLNIAECYAAKGDIGNTITYLGKIRNRVGIPSANNYGIGTLADKYAAINATLYERRVELAYEGKRFWDVQRWMLYSDDAIAGTVDNTNQKLGLSPINGTQRIGQFLQYKNTATSTDPLSAVRASITVDPDDANFNTQITTLANFYTNNFVLTNLVTPMDNNGTTTAVNILWRPNYYVKGLTLTILTQNPWLKQTIGWNDAANANGTYNYQE